MQLRWTEEAADDLERIADYLLTHAPDRAAELVRASDAFGCFCFTTLLIGLAATRRNRAHRSSQTRVGRYPQ